MTEMAKVKQNEKNEQQLKKKRMPTKAMISATKPEKNSQIPATKKTATTITKYRKKNE